MILEVITGAVKGVLSNGAASAAIGATNLAVSLLLARWIHVTAAGVRELKAARRTDAEMKVLKLEVLQELKTQGKGG